MKNILSIVLLYFIILNNSLACLNGDTRQLKNGHVLFYSIESMVPYGHYFPSNNNLKQLIYKFDSIYKGTKDIDYLSDKGLLLILLKQYKEAIKLYSQIEKIEPNRYSTASNIGTAYELIGDNVNAIKWIKKSISIDSNSHEGSEWIHLKILESKIKGDSFITSRFLINTDFKNDTLPITNLSDSALIKLYSGLIFQLNERMTFIEPKDKVVGILLFELGNIFLILKQYREAFQNYQNAKEYGFNNNLVDIRINKIISTLVTKNNQQYVPQKKNYLTHIILVSIIFGIIFLTFLYFRKKIK